LSTDTLLTAFDERLQSESPHIVQKALAVIEAMAKDPSCAKHKQHFADHCDEILALYDEAEKPSIRKQARNTLSALGVNYEGHMEGNASAAPEVSHNGNDLLGVEGATGSSQNTGAPATNQSNPEDELGDLFGNTAPPSSSDNEVGDMFGGLNIGGSAAEQTKGDSFPWASSVPPSSSHEQAGNDDLFNNMGQSSGDDLFSGMSLNTSEGKSGNQGGQGSGFSFANNESGAQEQTSGFSFARNAASMEQNEPQSGFSFAGASPPQNAGPMQPPASGFSFTAGSDTSAQPNWMGADEDGLLDNMQQPTNKGTPQKQPSGTAAPNGSSQMSAKANGDDPFGFVDTEFQI
jgi:hypothetical protein